LPLLDGGRARMAVIGIHDLCRAMEAILHANKVAGYNLYYDDMPTLGEILCVVRKIVGRKVLFVPVPAALLLLPLSLLCCLRIPTPVDLDNLKGYITSLAPYHPTNLSTVLPHPSTLQVALAEAWEGERVEMRGGIRSSMKHRNSQQISSN